MENTTKETYYELMMKSVADLKKIASSRGLTGYSKLNKEALVYKINPERKIIELQDLAFYTNEKLDKIGKILHIDMTRKKLKADKIEAIAKAQGNYIVDDPISEDLGDPNGYIASNNIKLSRMTAQAKRLLIKSVYRHHEKKITQEVLDIVGKKIKYSNTISVHRVEPKWNSKQHRKVMITYKPSKKEFYAEDIIIDPDFVRIAAEILYQFRRKTNHRIKYKLYQLIEKVYSLDDVTGEKPTGKFQKIHANGRPNGINDEHFTIGESYNRESITTNVEDSVAKLLEVKTEYKTRGSSGYINRHGGCIIEIYEIFEPIIVGDVSGLGSKYPGVIDIPQNEVWKEGKCFIINLKHHDLTSGRKLYSKNDWNSAIKSIKLTKKDGMTYKQMETLMECPRLKENYYVNLCTLDAFTNKPKIYRRIGTKTQTNQRIYMFSEPGNEKHLAYVKNVKTLFNKYFKKQSNSNSYYVCEDCFAIITYSKEDKAKERYEAHIKRCGITQGLVVTEKIAKNTIVRWDKWDKEFKVQAIMCGDFECNSQGIHEPYAYGLATSYNAEEFTYNVVCKDGPNFEDELKRLIFGNANELAAKLIRDHNKYSTYSLKERKKFGEFDLYDSKKESKRAENDEVICYLCRYNAAQVYDHCHRTGTILGMACNKCNSQRKEKLTIILFHHNGTRYDNVFLLPMCQKNYDGWAISQDNIMATRVNFKAIKFTKKFADYTVTLQVLDSINFINSSLSSIIKDYKDNWKDFKFSQKLIKKYHTQEQKDGWFAKVDFPYNEIDPHKQTDRLTDDVEMFRSDLKHRVPLNGFCTEYKAILDEKVIKAFNGYKDACKLYNITNNRDYMLEYLKRDCILLLDSLLVFQRSYYEMESMNICPFRFVSFPSFSFNWMLKHSNSTYTVMNSVWMHKLFKQYSFGGLSCAFKDYASDNVYECDATSMYPASMLEPMPVKLLYYREESIEYEKLVPLFNKYMVFFSATIEFSQEAQRKLRLFSPKISRRILPDKSKKLVMDFQKTENAFYCHQYWQCLIKHGATVSNIKNVFVFQTSTKLAKTVQYLAKQRAAHKQSGNKVKSMQCKNMMNSNYGVYGQNVEKYQNSKIVDSYNYDLISKYESTEGFCRAEELSAELDLVIFDRSTVQYDKFPNISKAILDIAKVNIINFVIDSVLATFGEEHINLLQTDTDSIHFEVVDIENPYDYFRKMSRYMDLSTIPREFFSEPITDEEYYENAGVLGKYKLENKGALPRKFHYAYAPKTYTVKEHDGTEITKCKGVPHSLADLNGSYTIQNARELTNAKESITSFVHKGNKIITKTFDRVAISKPETKVIRDDKGDYKFYGYYDLITDKQLRDEVSVLDDIRDIDSSFLLKSKEFFAEIVGENI